MTSFSSHFDVSFPSNDDDVRYVFVDTKICLKTLLY